MILRMTGFTAAVHVATCGTDIAMPEELIEQVSHENDRTCECTDCR